MPNSVIQTPQSTILIFLGRCSVIDQSAGLFDPLSYRIFVHLIDSNDQCDMTTVILFFTSDNAFDDLSLITLKSSMQAESLSTSLYKLLLKIAYHVNGKVKLSSFFVCQIRKRFIIVNDNPKLFDSWTMAHWAYLF